MLLGKILRINPKDPDGSGPKHYSIPADNPFVGAAGRDEVYAYGLRNPWRDSFDALTGDLWIGDVGQDRYEEVDHVASGNGKNFGWHLLEGFHLYPSGGTLLKQLQDAAGRGVRPRGQRRGQLLGHRRLRLAPQRRAALRAVHLRRLLQRPDLARLHVVQRCALPAPAEHQPEHQLVRRRSGPDGLRGRPARLHLPHHRQLTVSRRRRGKYLYGDYCSGKMWIISASGAPGVPQDVTPTGGGISVSSFARDASGELYAMDLGGSIYALHLTGTP